MKRRQFLAMLGSSVGASLISPYAMSTTLAPKRFVFVVEGNGLDPIGLISTQTLAAIQSESTDSLDGRRSFSSLYGHAGPIVETGDLGTAPCLSPLLSTAGSQLDLTTRSSVTLGLSSKITGGGHVTYFGGLSSTRSSSSRPAGPTIDAVLGAISDVDEAMPFDVLRVGVDAGTEALRNTVCAYSTGRPAPVVVDPIQAYNSVFGSVAGPAGAAAFRRRGELLEHAWEASLGSLARTTNSNARRKLTAYRDSLDTLRSRQSQLQQMAPVLELVAPEDPATNPLYASQDSLLRLQSQFELVTAALIGGLTRVAVITAGAGGKFDMAYPSLVPELTRHDLHHLAGGDLSLVPHIHAVTRRHVELIADMARTLALVSEGDGTMLDNTVIVFLSDNGERHHGEAIEYPVLMVGGQAMGLHNDGRTTVFPGVKHANNRQLSNFYNTLGYAAGMQLDDFGGEGPTRIAYGPLAELYS
jgi:hypothetical protein